MHAATELQPTTEVTCSDLNSICLDGTLRFNSSSGKITYNGEVKSANRAGEVRVIFSGKSNLNGNSNFIMRAIRFKVSGMELQKITIELPFRRAIGKTDMVWELTNVLYLDEIVKNTNLEEPFKGAIIKRIPAKGLVQ